MGAVVKITASQTGGAGVTGGAAGVGGDLSGSLPAPLVVAIQGVPVCVTAPNSGNILTFDGTQWCPSASTSTTGYALNHDGVVETITAHGNLGAAATFFSSGTGNLHTGTLNANCTFTFAAVTSGKACSFTMLLTQDATGSRTVTWPGSVVWQGSAPVLATAAASVDILTFFTLDGGTTWYGFHAGSAISPLTTKGDLFGRSTVDARIPIGANGTRLRADSTQTLGLAWSALVWTPLTVYNGTNWLPLVDGGGNAILAEV